MAQIDNTIAEVPDERLRARLQSEADALRRRGQFGLVFERHSPEWLLMPGARVRAGVSVLPRDESWSPPLRVEAVEGADAICVPESGGLPLKMPVTSLAVVKRDGEAVFPALRLVDTVTQGCRRGCGRNWGGVVSGLFNEP